WTLQGSCVGNAQHRVRRFNVVSGAETRLRLPVSGECVVEIAAQARTERPVSRRDRILEVEREFLHVRVPVEGEQTSSCKLSPSAGHVIGCQNCARRAQEY